MFQDNNDKLEFAPKYFDKVACYLNQNSLLKSKCSRKISLFFKQRFSQVKRYTRLNFSGQLLQVQHVQLPLLIHGDCNRKQLQLHPDLQQASFRFLNITHNIHPPGEMSSIRGFPHGHVDLSDTKNPTPVWGTD